MLHTFEEDPRVVLVQEFRSPGRGLDGFVHELPGGSAPRDKDPRLAAADEVREETGLTIDPDRLLLVGSRQAAATVSTHKVMCFTATLSREEMDAVEARAVTGEVHGDAEASEQTRVEVLRLSDLMQGDEVDWSTLGMIAETLYFAP